MPHANLQAAVRFSTTELENPCDFLGPPILPHQSGSNYFLVAPSAASTSAADRPIENTDLVFWYTMGHTHVPRPEDYPVMPAAYIGFLLKPSGFFHENPANDLPPSPKKQGESSCCH